MGMPIKETIYTWQRAKHKLPLSLLKRNLIKSSQSVVSKEKSFSIQTSSPSLISLYTKHTSRLRTGIRYAHILNQTMTYLYTHAHTRTCTPSGFVVYGHLCNRSVPLSKVPVVWYYLPWSGKLFPSKSNTRNKCWVPHMKYRIQHQLGTLPGQCQMSMLGAK